MVLGYHEPGCMVQCAFGAPQPSSRHTPSLFQSATLRSRNRGRLNKTAPTDFRACIGRSVNVLAQIGPICSLLPNETCSESLTGSHGLQTARCSLIKALEPLKVVTIVASDVLSTKASAFTSPVGVTAVTETAPKITGALVVSEIQEATLVFGVLWTGTRFVW